MLSSLRSASGEISGNLSNEGKADRHRDIEGAILDHLTVQPSYTSVHLPISK